MHFTQATIVAFAALMTVSSAAPAGNYLIDLVAEEPTKSPSANPPSIKPIPIQLDPARTTGLIAGLEIIKDSRVTAQLKTTTVNTSSAKKITGARIDGVAGPWCAAFSDAAATVYVPGFEGSDGIFNSVNSASYGALGVYVNSFWCAETKKEVEARIKKTAIQHGDIAPAPVPVPAPAPAPAPVPVPEGSGANVGSYSPYADYGVY